MLKSACPNGSLGCVFANRARNTNFGIVKTNSSAPRELILEKLETLVSHDKINDFGSRMPNFFGKLRKCYVSKRKM